MKILLDTHTFIWWSSAPERLSDKGIALCQDTDNALLLSVASVWEMQIKMQLGKLKLDLPLKELIASQQEKNNLQVLPVELGHVLELNNLPFHHNDPFDRLLIAQAKSEDALLMSKDKVFSAYPVKLIW
jgi:PIN domain nuclease of toxin-antitoxin system